MQWVIMMSDHDNMVFFDAETGVFFSHGAPAHETVSLDGIPIDKQIASVIKSLWDRGLPTMRSCQDANGYVYIAFKNLHDALMGGLLIADQFIMNVTPNDENGGYAAIALFIRPDHIHVAVGRADPSELYKFLAPYINRTVKAYKKSGLLKAIYNQSLLCDGIADRFVALGGTHDRYAVAKSGIYHRAWVVPAH